MSTLTLKGLTSGSSVLKAPDSGSNEVTFTMPASAGTLLTTTGSASNLTGVADATKLPLAGGTMTGSTIHNDNVKDIYGTSSDGLEIYHSGAASFISDTGTGVLYITGNQIYFKNAASNEAMLGALEDGTVTLYYNDAAKLATTSTGIDVTGSVVADGASLDGAVVINESSADVDFRVESNANTHGLFLEGSTGNVGIGSTPGDNKLHIYDTSSWQPQVVIENASTSATTPSQLQFYKSRGAGAGVSGDYLGQIAFNGDDDTSTTETTFAAIWAKMDDAAAASKDGSIHFSTMVANTDTEVLTLKGGRGVSQFTAKAWCMYDPTPVIKDSHNISSVTDSGVGNFRINFDVDLANANYAAIGTASTKSGSHNDTVAVSYEAYNTASTAAWLFYRTSNTTQTDPDRMHSVYFGD